MADRQRRNTRIKKVLLLCLKLWKTVRREKSELCMDGGGLRVSQVCNNDQRSVIATSIQDLTHILQRKLSANTTTNDCLSPDTRLVWKHLGVRFQALSFHVSPNKS